MECKRQRLEGLLAAAGLALKMLAVDKGLLSPAGGCRLAAGLACSNCPAVVHRPRRFLEHGRAQRLQRLGGAAACCELWCVLWCSFLSSDHMKAPWQRQQTHGHNAMLLCRAGLGGRGPAPTHARHVPAAACGGGGWGAGGRRGRRRKRRGPAAGRPAAAQPASRHRGAGRQVHHRWEALPTAANRCMHVLQLAAGISAAAAPKRPPSLFPVQS